VTMRNAAIVSVLERKRELAEVQPRFARRRAVRNALKCAFHQESVRHGIEHKEEARAMADGVDERAQMRVAEAPQLRHTARDGLVVVRRQFLRTVDVSREHVPLTRIGAATH
jgi:hypothetical protein